MTRDKQRVTSDGGNESWRGEHEQEQEMDG